MPNYETSWSQATPGFLLFLLDSSFSMQNGFGDRTRALVAAKAINDTIDEIIERNENGSDVKRRCYVEVISYTDTPRILLKGGIDLIAEELRGKITPQVAEGGTNMYEAFCLVKNECKDYINEYPDCPAPVVIHITDGIPTIAYGDEDANMRAVESIISDIKKLRSSDGNVLIYNAAINERNKPLYFPRSNYGLDKYARFIFDISSEVPSNSEYPKGTRGCVIGNDTSQFIDLINFGSRRATRK